MSPPPPTRRSHLLALCGLALGAQPTWSQRSDTPAALAPGVLAPDFSLPDVQGRSLQLQSLRGRVVLINFWATWCGPCRAEMPQLEQLHAHYTRAGLSVLGVSVDNNPEAARQFALQLKPSFAILLDPQQQVSRRYAVSAMPSTVLLDRQGRVQHLHRGYRPGYEQTYAQQIQALLKA